MLHFRKITLADKLPIDQFTLVNARRNCDLCFANLYSWSFLYQSEYAIAENALFFRFYIRQELMYMLPVTEHITLPILELILEDAQQMGQPFVLAGVCADTISLIEELMPSRFEFIADRDFADYIYKVKDLASLSGKKYQAKRNHINQFKRNYPDYSYQELTPDFVPLCLSLEESWCQEHDVHNQTALLAERKSMTRSLHHLEELKLKGGVLLIDKKIVAFTFGAQLNESVFDVCVEKADALIEGAYAMINYEFVNHLPSQYIYVNREEDLGMEGLRKSKLSYYPYLLLEKYTARLK